MNTPRTNISIPNPLWEKIRDLAKAERRPITQQLAIILEAHFAEREKAKGAKKGLEK